MTRTTILTVLCLVCVVGCSTGDSAARAIIAKHAAEMSAIETKLKQADGIADPDPESTPRGEFEARIALKSSILAGANKDLESLRASLRKEFEAAGIVADDGDRAWRKYWAERQLLPSER